MFIEVQLLSLGINTDAIIVDAYMVQLNLC
jgi:hypothetical protein